MLDKREKQEYKGGVQGIEEKQKREELKFPLVKKDQFDFLTKCHIEVLAKKSTDVVIEKINQKIDEVFDNIFKCKS